MLTQKFTRQSRLLKPAEFKHVFQRPFRSSDSCFRILARPNDISSPRLGMAVSKKACPKAVGRNRIKRLVRESFRSEVIAQFAANPTTEKTLDFVVLPSADAASKSNSGLKASLNAHWQKLILKAADQQTGPGKHQGHE